MSVEQMPAIDGMVVPGTDTIDVAMLQRLRVQDPLVRIFDVRTGGEFETAHIPGSCNIPLDTLVERIDEFCDVQHPIVLVCQSGSRASYARRYLASTGKTNLHVLEGGMNVWNASNGELTRDQKSRWFWTGKSV